MSIYAKYGGALELPKMSIRLIGKQTKIFSSYWMVIFCIWSDRDRIGNMYED